MSGVGRGAFRGYSNYTSYEIVVSVGVDFADARNIHEDGIDDWNFRCNYVIVIGGARINYYSL